MTMGQSPARRVAIAGVVGALYVVLSITPFSYGPVQFRIGEALKPLVIKYPAVIPAFGIGTTFGTYLASLVYALWTATGVGVVLTVSAGLPYLPSFASVAVSEIILLLLGNALLVRRI
jgi:uncharacterized membrane protein